MNRKAVLLENGVDLDGAVLSGPVLIPVITGVGVSAAKKGRNHQEMELTVAIPANICPDPDDVTWIASGLGCQIRNVYVVIEFRPGALKGTVE